MSEKKIKILGIAPYEGMKSIMLQLAKERKDLDLDVYIGDLSKGVEIALQNFHSNYDVIISRGGTAELIGHSTPIPVIEVSLSVYDILRAIKLAENYTDRYAIVGFQGITRNAHLLCDLLQYKIDIFTVHDEKEVLETLSLLKRKGYSMVLCDMIATTTAKRLGLNAILITSGNESITSAFDQAVKLSKSYIAIKSENNFLKSIIRGTGEDIIVLDPDSALFFSSLPDSPPQAIIELLQKELPNVQNNDTHKCLKNLNGILYSVVGKKILFNNIYYTVFYFSASIIPITTGRHGIQYSSDQVAEDPFFNSFYNMNSLSNNTLKNAKSLGQASLPVMIFGETGAGKEQTARLIFSQSSLQNNPMITINCGTINEKSWAFLVNHLNSPFNDNNNTIFIKDITLLPESRRRQLLSIITDTNLCKRNKIILSCICNPNSSTPQEAMEFVNVLSCITINLPPLRERAETIPTLSSLYLNDLNISIASQIIGFKPEAMQLLQAYSWPSNYTQFKRILNELALTTTTSYINSQQVSAILEKEQQHISPVLDSGVGNTLFDLNKTLDEINQDVILQVLKEVNSNQSAAAKRLGISRTTLWRYLK